MNNFGSATMSTFDSWGLLTQWNKQTNKTQNYGDLVIYLCFVYWDIHNKRLQWAPLLYPRRSVSAEWLIFRNFQLNQAIYICCRALHHWNDSMYTQSTKIAQKSVPYWNKFRTLSGGGDTSRDCKLMVCCWKLLLRCYAMRYACIVWILELDAALDKVYFLE